VHARFWWGNQKGTNCFKGLGIGKIVLKSVLKTCGGRARTAFIWLGVMRSGGLLKAR
jgi:hypothetical protein